jgi:small subunit ribosomal protein S19e
LTNVRDVPAAPLINKIAVDLKDNQKIVMPEWAEFVKTGCSKERVPDFDDWWQVRMASILRKVYIKGKVTVKYLRTYYGGKKNRGVRPEKFRKSSGKIIRVCLQDLANLGLVNISDTGGRVLTQKGQGYLDKMASDLFRELYPDKKPFDTSSKKTTKTTKTTKAKTEKKTEAKVETPKVAEAKVETTKVVEAKVEVPKVAEAKVETTKVVETKVEKEAVKVETKE